MEEERKLEPSKQNRLSGRLKKGEIYIVRHRQGTETVKILKGVDLKEDKTVKVENVSTQEKKELNIFACFFEKVVDK